MSGAAFLERLAARSEATGGVLCVGIDPHPAELPAGFPPDVHGIERFARLIVEACAPYAAAVKPNLAFFEAFGSAGLASLERVRAAIPAGLPVILDAKRGDIGSTAERQAAALLDALGADAVTLSPYLGPDAVTPFLEHGRGFAYVLCRTSNPGADEIQGLRLAAGEQGPDELSAAPATVAERVALRVANWGPADRLGLVVGATAPAELERVRRLAPGLPFLVPGVGAQGGQVAPVLRAGPATAPPASGRPGGGLLVNVSRGIARAALAAEPGAAGATLAAGPAARPPADPAERLAAAARAWAEHLPVLSSGAAGG